MSTSDDTRRGVPSRLAFRLPDFTRCAWTSDQARQAWEPRAQRIIEMLFALEWRTIVAGIRACALESIPAHRLAELRGQLSTHGIEIEPLQPMGPRASYASSLEPYAGGSPSAFWSAIGRRDDLQALCEAHRRGDQQVIGRLLGYPGCCVDFFQEIWVDRGMVDTTWPMAARTKSAIVRSDRHIEIPRPSPCGVHLRWLGVRGVFHLPCSLDCAESTRIAGAIADLASELGHAQEIGWIDEMRCWPAEWSALHGIAEIKTPVVKIVTRTDATPDKYVVRCLGDPSSLPEEAAPGIGFPYRAPRRLPLVANRGFQLGLENPISDVSDDSG